MNPLPFAVAAILASMVPALADTVPNLDVEQTCRSSQVANTSISDQANYDGCLRSEREAKKEAERKWGTYSSAAKRQCEDQFKAGGFPSYVEMVTCLELASGTVPTQSDASGQGVKPQREGGATLTREPPASQRTNPIEVLEQK